MRESMTDNPQSAAEAGLSARRLAHAALALICLLLVGAAHAWDRDLDNDGRWDYDRGGTDRDVDNDGRWDHDKGGSDRDLDNDGRWDFDAGESDRDIDNDGRWDYDKGGTDRDLDNDNRWDGSMRSPQDLYVATIASSQ